MRECKVPLRIILQNFINNVESLEAKKSDKDEIYEQEFQELKKLTESLKTHPDYLCSEGEKECNRRKNRYKDILPYDQTRVVLQAYPGIPGSDYINANYVRGASGSKAYIASQGPLPNTVPDFWRMVVECDVQVIIMASNETEGGKHKCECYWVEKEGEDKQFGNVLVSFIKSKQICPDFLVRTLRIKYTTEDEKTEEKTICQFHYMLWPDHGVPDTVRPLLHMVRLVRDCQASETLPVLVHCSAGCGRTGTICAIDYVWGLLRSGKLNENLNLLSLVREMRGQRVAMVQTREQYSLLHQAVKELFRDRLSLIDSHPYENVSTDGNPLSHANNNDKESDYEELLMSHESEDMNIGLGTTSMGCSSGVTNSQASAEWFSRKDNLRRSASTSSLDLHKTTSVLRDCSWDYPVSSSHAFQSTIPQSLQLNSSEFKPYAPSTTAMINDVTRKRPSVKVSTKTEKEAKNIAQKLETKDAVSLRPVSPLQLYSQRKQLKLPASMSSKSFDDNINPSVLIPPPPPPRSRTPSPNACVRSATFRDSSLDKRKSSEIVRRPSIQKYKDLFEKSPRAVIECPNGTKLFRSASSVTFRPKLSVHPNMASGSKGLVEHRFERAFPSEKRFKEKRYPVCPPPPPVYNVTDSSVVDSLTLNLKRFSLNDRDLKSRPNQNPVSDLKSSRSVSNRSHKDERPALPIKSKSFRYARSPVSSNLIPSKEGKLGNQGNASLESLNVYYSLDRGKENDIQPRIYKCDNGVKKIANDFYPSNPEGLKLSVYGSAFEIPKALPKSAQFNMVGEGEKAVTKKPVVPPKRILREKLRQGKIPPLQIPITNSSIDVDNTFLKGNQTPRSAPPNSSKSFDNKRFWDEVQSGKLDNFYQKLPPNMSSLSKEELSLHSSSDINVDVSNSLNNQSDCNSELVGNHDYVNARVLSSYIDDEHAHKLSYVPMPTKRILKEKSTHDYANCEIFTNISSSNSEKAPSDTANPLHVLESTDEVKHETQRLSSTTTDYEPVDFGETTSGVDEVFEAINHEVIEDKTKKHNDQFSNQEYYLNRDLDSLATRVYEDCQAYLLHGNDRSTVPSLMPKRQDQQGNFDKKSSESKSVISNNNLTDLEQVKNKVCVPPQGLRNRERRNSYRQAVNTVSQTPIKDGYQPDLTRKIHKYEKIWFEGMIEDRDEESEAFGETSTNPSVEAASNMNPPVSRTDKNVVVFKDKMRALHAPSSKKLPDLSEEEISSRDSGSTASLVSKSSHSSRISEKNDPIYANINFKQQNPSNSNASSGKRPQPLPKRTSAYGTLATPTYPSQSLSIIKSKSKTLPNSMDLPPHSTAFATQSSTQHFPANIPPPTGFNPPTGFKGSYSSVNPNSTDYRHTPFHLGPNHTFRPNQGGHRNERRKMSEMSSYSEATSRAGETNRLGPPNRKLRNKQFSGKQDFKTRPEAPISRERIPLQVNPSLNPSVYHHQPLTVSNTYSGNHVQGPSRTPNQDVPQNVEFSSTDTDDDGTLSNMTSTTNLLRKLKNSTKIQFKNRDGDLGDIDSRVDRVRLYNHSSNSPPHSLSKALGKFKTGSKNVAANFRSYLSSKAVADGSTESSTTSFPSTQHRPFPLQKSVSSGPSISLFTQVVEESDSSSNAMPKDTIEDLPPNFRCYDHPPSKMELKTNRARQHYL